jgi:hypothetical protein
VGATSWLWTPEAALARAGFLAPPWSAQTRRRRGALGKSQWLWRRDLGVGGSPGERADGSWCGRCGGRDWVLPARAAPWRLATSGIPATCRGCCAKSAGAAEIQSYERSTARLPRAVGDCSGLWFWGLERPSGATQRSPTGLVSGAVAALGTEIYMGPGKEADFDSSSGGDKQHEDASALGIGGSELATGPEDGTSGVRRPGPEQDRF